MFSLETLKLTIVQGNDVFFTGTSEEIGKFAVVILPKPEEEESMKLQVISMQSEAHTQWQIKGY